MSGLEIHPACPDDHADLTAIAQAAKAHWDYPPEWLEAWRSQLTITPEYLRAHHVFVAQGDEGIFGFAALVVEDAHAELDHFWVRPTAMGRGVGRRLFEHVVRQAERLGLAGFEIESDPYAEDFYLHLGAVRTGEVERPVLGEARRLPVLFFACDAALPRVQSPP